MAIYTLGAFFGAMSCIWLGDRLGRIRTIMIGAALNTVGALLQASSFSLGQLIVGRVVSGLGFGALSATAPNWQSECSKAEHRGSVVILESLFISLGLGRSLHSLMFGFWAPTDKLPVALVSWISFGVSYASGSVTWRLPLALSGLWSIIVIAVIYPLPESPRWLVREGKVDEARQVLAALSDVAVDSEQVNKDITEIQESLASTGNGRFLDVFTNGKERLFHRTCLAAAGQLFQQLCGINTIAFYVSTIFQQDLGLSAVDSRVLGAAVFSWQTLASPIGVLTVDRLGRRKLMLVSCVGMGVCMAILAGTVSQSHNHAAIIVAGISIFVFSGFFPVGSVLKSGHRLDI